MDICIGILPFRYLEKNEKIDLLIEGFYFDLVLILSKYPSLSVISTESTSHFQGTPHPDELKQLGIQYFISGIFRSRQNQLNFGIQLTRAKDSKVIFASNYAKSPEEMFLGQEEIAQQIVNAFHFQIDQDIISDTLQKNQVEFSAYENYLLGIQLLKKGGLEHDEEARKYFKAALEINPQYANAYTGLSLSYFNEWSCQLWERWDISRKGAYSYALKALELNPNDYVALQVVGRAVLFAEGYEMAEEYLRKSIRLNPNDANNLVKIALSFMFLNLSEEAISLYQRACKLNPLHADQYNAYASNIYFEYGDFSTAIDLGKKVSLDQAWVDFPAYMAAAYFYLGKEKEMREQWKNYLANFSQFVAPDQVANEKEALLWQIRVNPYKETSRLQDFWNYIDRSQGLDLKSSLNWEKPPENPRFFLKGEVWEIYYAGKLIHMRSTKGLRDLHQLLSRPHEEISCLILDNRMLIENHAIELIDEQAKQAYRERILHLQGQIQEAEGTGSPTQLSQLQEEYDALLHHLQASLGLAGKTRTVSNEAGRARSAVRLRIKKSLDKIKEAHPELGKHLVQSIKTGTNCAYLPETELNWEL